MENNEPVTPRPADDRAEGDRGFAACLKRIRTALRNKQVWLSGAIGCSDAAVSLWESGARVPSPQSLGRLLAALAEEGTPTSELLELRRMWVAEYAGRRAGRPPLR